MFDDTLHMLTIRPAQESAGVVHESILTRILQSSAQQDQDSIAETEDLCASVAATVYTGASLS